MPRMNSRRNMAGVSLIEILVSVVIIGIGLLGIAAMQSMALRGGQSSLESSQAMMQTQSILESMRANRANAGAYVTAGMLCDPDEVAAGNALAADDLTNWVQALKATMGLEDDDTTCGQIAVDGNGTWTVTVQWDDSRGGGAAERQVATETRI